MWKILLSMLVFSVLVALAGGSIINTLQDATKATIKEAKVYIGENIILSNDTLLIIDYSLLNNNFKLEDGRTVSLELIKKLELIHSK